MRGELWHKGNEGGEYDKGVGDEKQDVHTQTAQEIGSSETLVS